MWLFWRIVLYGVNETFHSVNRMTLKEMLQYNMVINFDNAVQKINSSEVST